MSQACLLRESTLWLKALHVYMHDSQVIGRPMFFELYCKIKYLFKQISSCFTHLLLQCSNRYPLQILISNLPYSTFHPLLLFTCLLLNSSLRRCNIFLCLLCDLTITATLLSLIVKLINPHPSALNELPISSCLLLIFMISNSIAIC